MINYIKIKGAKENNLKNVDLTIPRDKLVVFTGLSGSGKSTLAFDTIFAEGQRKYMESLSSYARMFLGQMEKPDVESIEGLFHRSENHVEQPSLHGGNGDGDLRLSSFAVCPRGHAALSEMRQSDRKNNGRSDRGAGACDARGK